MKFGHGFDQSRFARDVKRVSRGQANGVSVMTKRLREERVSNQGEVEDQEGEVDRV